MIYLFVCVCVFFNFIYREYDREMLPQRPESDLRLVLLPLAFLLRVSWCMDLRDTSPQAQDVDFGNYNIPLKHTSAQVINYLYLV